MLVDIVNTLESGALTDRPRQWANGNLQFFFQLIENIEWVTSLTVHLVDEDDNRSIAHAAHLHQFAGLCLHTLGRIHHDDGRIHGGEGTVGILAEVLVTWSIEDIHLVRFSGLSIWQVIELHHGCGNRDTTLFLDIHPVGSSSFTNLIIFNGTSHLNLSTEEQELLGQSCLTGIRVRNDGKCSSSFNLFHLLYIVIYIL